MKIPSHYTQRDLILCHMPRASIASPLARIYLKPHNILLQHHKLALDFVLFLGNT